ncbi:MAG: DUF881 domain-containing protein [Mycobacteriaceae bacterium]
MRQPYHVAPLLELLQTEHLDPGYAAAAAKPGGRRWSTTWLAVAGILVGLVLGIGAAQAASRAPDTNVVRAGLASDVRAARTTQQELTQRESALAEQAAQARATALAGNAEGRAALAELDRLSALAAASKVVGPGLVVTLADSASGNGSGKSGTAAIQSRGTILDRDLQQVVNALWGSGAEAIAVGGVRLDPLSTIRQAGGAMLVNNQPITAPYSISAIGKPNLLETGFVVSDAYTSLSAVAKAYGVGFSAVARDKIELPAAVPADVRYAVPEGHR